MVRRAGENGYSWLPDADRDVYVDDGYSGGDPARPALGRLRQAARARQVDIVLCYDPDRLSRNPSDLLLLADEFGQQGVRLEFITRETDSLRPAWKYSGWQKRSSRP